MEFFDNLQTEETYAKENIYFINILDGNTAMKQLPKFKYLIEKEKYKSIQNNIFIGDMYTFNQWYSLLKYETVNENLVSII